METLSAFLEEGLKMAIFERSIKDSFSTIPPCTPAWGLGLVCFFTRFTPLTKHLLLGAKAETVPCLPLSLPAITITSSPFLIYNMVYKTSGAKEIILINSSPLSSLETGPNTLVPIGCF